MRRDRPRRVRRASAAVAALLSLGGTAAFAADGASAPPFGSDIDGRSGNATLFFYPKAECPALSARDACYVVAFSCVPDGSAVLTLRATAAEMAGLLASDATAVVDFGAGPSVVLAALSVGLEAVGGPWQFRFFADGRRGDKAWLAGLGEAVAIEVRRSDGAVLTVPFDAENRRDAAQFVAGCLRD